MLLNAIKELLGQLKGLYNGLVGDDKTSFAPLEQIYNYYVGKCEALAVGQ